MNESCNTVVEWVETGIACFGKYCEDCVCCVACRNDLAIPSFICKGPLWETSSCVQCEKTWRQYSD